MTPDPLLVVDDLRTCFATPHGTVQAVDGVSFSVASGELVGMVGESGSGKSVCMRTAMGLIASDPTTRVSGSVRFDGREVTQMGREERRALWAREIAIVLQDPMTSLNPVKTVGAHLQEPLRLHLGMGRRDSAARAVELLEQVGLPEPARRLRQYPHELSGGMRQRVCIALALSCRPRLLIADEPTTALDVTVQRQILDLIEKLTAETGMATVLVTHDLGVVRARAPRVLVMYAGRIVEQGPTDALLRNTQHPYARALLCSVPRLSDPPGTRLASIPGAPPDVVAPGVGCAFAPRCPMRVDVCDVLAPPSRAVDPASPEHEVRCHRAEVVGAVSPEAG